METTRHHTTHDPVTGALAELAAVTERVAAAVADGGRARMATAGSLLAATDRLTAVVIGVLSRVTHRGVIADEGLSVGAWLRTFAGRTTGDEKMLAACVERLADMPTVAGWLADNTVSWSVVRSIVLATRNLTREQRCWVDTTLAADHERVVRLDADQVVAAVDGLVDQARADLHRDRERRSAQDEWLRMQDGLDGSVTGQFRLGAESAELFRRAIAGIHPTKADHTDHEPDGAGPADHSTGHPDEPDDTATSADATDATVDGADGTAAPTDAAASETHADAADPDASTVAAAAATSEAADASHPDDDASTEHDDHADVGETGGEDLGGFDRWRQGRERRNAQALLGLCRQRLGMPGGAAPSAARPAMLLIADINALHGDGVGSATAQLMTLTAHGPVEVTAAAAERLACDATWRVVFTDGDRILGVSAAHPKVSATLRAALIVRDGGCRFPACPQPAEACENHHVVPVKAGGPTTLENLALICNAHHHAIHDSGWVNRLHPDGTMTFTRHGVTITSAPRAHQRLQPCEPPPAGRPTRRRWTDPTAADLTANSDPEHDPDPPPVDLPF
jgi:hypothetical protein